MRSVKIKNAYIDNMTSVVAEVGRHRKVHEKIVTKAILSEGDECVEPVKVLAVPRIAFKDGPASEILQKLRQRLVADLLDLRCT